jgi:hypothetical protein
VHRARQRPSAEACVEPTEQFERVGVPRAAERCESPDYEDGLIEGYRLRLLEPASHPPQRVSLASRPIAKADQRRQLERLAQVQRPGIARLDLCDDDVAALQRPPQRCSRVSVVAQDLLSSWGRTQRA